MTSRSAPHGVVSWIRLAAAVICLWLTLAIPDARAAQSLHHDLAVRLEPATREVRVEDTITVHGSTHVECGLARRFVVERVSMDGAPVAVASEPAPPQRHRWRIPLQSSPQGHSLVVRYRGRLDPLPDADHRDVLQGLPPMADPRGSFLPGGTGWYPECGTTFFTYRLSLDLPDDQRGLVPGRLIDERNEDGRYRATFAFAHPAESIDLMAGPYQVRERIVRQEGTDALRLRTYFHADLADLADEYLAAVGDYVSRYSRWIGPYPFTEFSVVSSPLPTGFGMPTLTYMGVRVLRLPFIRNSSLGHEVLHNWWGNGVYADFGRGNWSEGLTAFMADYTYKEQQGPDAAREARLELLRDVAAIPPGQDTPLRGFTSRSHGTSQIVGYHKGTFVFLMLRDLLGTPLFDEGLRRFWREHQFRTASWADIERAFEDASGRKLDGFFDQWLSRTGAPHFRIETAKAERTGSAYGVRITVNQDGSPYAVRMPVTVTTPNGRTEHQLNLSRARQEFALEASAPPQTVALDPDFRVLRKLDAAEMPPILRQVMVDPTTVTVGATMDETMRAAAAELSRALLDYPHALGDGATWGGNSPLFLIGLTADVDRFLARANLPGRPERVGIRGTAQVWATYQANGKVMTVVSAESAAALKALLRPLPHYGRQSYLIFDGAKAIERGVWPAQPSTWRFAEETR